MGSLRPSDLSPGKSVLRERTTGRLFVVDALTEAGVSGESILFACLTNVELRGRRSVRLPPDPELWEVAYR